MNWSKTTNKVIRNVTRAMPKALAGISIPFVARRRTSVLPYVFGAIGVAVAGGIAAVMIMSPRTRHRALDVAKDGYGKVKGQAIGITEKIGLTHGDATEKQPYANGLSPESSRQGSGYSTTGL